MAILVTGAAGFIGFHVSKALLSRGETVIGVDNLNSYYDPALKKARLAELFQLPEAHANFHFYQQDIADFQGVMEITERHEPVTHIVHLAAQAGVRYSIDHPFTYAHSNLQGHLSMLEVARNIKELQHFVYASSSSVYGNSQKLPYSITDRVETPISLYAATKLADEMMTHSYSHLYGIPATGFRFFTVYGPWGRPDMAIYLFTKAIYEGKPLRLFNNGSLKRDFTYIDDIVSGVLACLDRPPSLDSDMRAPCRIYNLGNHKSEPVSHFLALIEQALGKKAIIQHEPMQPGDMAETFADITESTRDFGYYPRTSITNGIPRFVEWFKAYHGDIYV